METKPFRLVHEEDDMGDTYHIKEDETDPIIISKYRKHLFARITQKSKQIDALELALADREEARTDGSSTGEAESEGGVDADVEFLQQMAALRAERRELKDKMQVYNRKLAQIGKDVDEEEEEEEKGKGKGKDMEKVEEEEETEIHIDEEQDEGNNNDENVSETEKRIAEKEREIATLELARADREEMRLQEDGHTTDAELEEDARLDAADVASLERATQELQQLLEAAGEGDGTVKERGAVLEEMKKQRARQQAEEKARGKEEETRRREEEDRRREEEEEAKKKAQKEEEEQKLKEEAKEEEKQRLEKEAGEAERGITQWGWKRKKPGGRRRKRKKRKGGGWRKRKKQRGKDWKKKKRKQEENRRKRKTKG